MNLKNLRQYLSENYSSSSVRSYENQIKRYVLWMESVARKGVEKASYEEVLSYVGSLRKLGLSGKSLRNNLFAIKIYYSYLQSIGKRKDHPCLYLNLKDQINRSVEVESLYSWQDLESYYEIYESKKERDQRRNKIIISLLIYQALTVSEISQLKLSSVDLSKGKITITNNSAKSKTKSRVLSLASHQILLFYTYLEKDWKTYHRQQKWSKRHDNFILNQEGLPMWTGRITRLLNNTKNRNCFSRKGIRLQAQKVRQSVIAHLLKSGKDVRIVQEFAGHRWASSTEVYKQSDLEELKQAIDKYHPLQ